MPLNRQRKTLIPIHVKKQEGNHNKKEGEAEKGCYRVFPSPVSAQVPEDVLMLQVSPSGRHVLYAKAAGEEKDKTCSVIWELCTSDGQLVRQVHVPPTIHGPVYSEGYISRGVAWAPDEKTVAYVAEAPRKHQTPNWSSDIAANADQVDGSSKPLGSWTGQGPYEEDFGELFPGKKCAAVYILDLSEGKVAKVNPLVRHDCPEDPYDELDAVTCGKPVFSPDSEFLVFTVWPHVQKKWRDENGLLVAAKKLGLVYCYNRECHLQVIKCSDVWQAREEGKTADPIAEEIPTSTASAHSAIFEPETSEKGYNLLFLSHDSAHSTGAHNACAALHSLKFVVDGGSTLKYNDPRNLVPVVGTPESRDAFQGLFCADLSEGAIHKGNLYLTSIHRCNTAILRISVSTGEVKIITDVKRSWNIIGAGQKRIVASTSAPCEIPSVHMYSFDSEEAGSFKWCAVYVPRNENKIDVSVSINEHKPDPSKSRNVDKDTFDSILLAPKHSSNREDTVLLVPHGGPHSAHICSWNIQYEFLLNLGYTLLLVNYRGSVGFGNDSLLSLPGFIGDHDVDDCIRALDFALSSNEKLKKVGVMGGSHGGFLTLHLLGQHPERFQVGVVRNPVTSIPGMVSATDIPDWCYVEAMGVGIRPKCYGPTAEDLDKMLRVSPIFHVKNVSAPTLWLLGKEDRRVRPLAAFDYIAALHSKSLKVKTVVFPKDSHPLNKPQTEFESYINICWWLNKCLD